MTATATIVWRLTEEDISNFIESAWPNKVTPEQRADIIKGVCARLDEEIGDMLYEAVGEFVEEWEA